MTNALFLTSANDDQDRGKAQMAAHSACALRAGMVICVGRIKEAQSMASELTLLPTQCTVLTYDPDANALGSSRRQAGLY